MEDRGSRLRPNDGTGRVVHEGDDPAPLHRILTSERAEISDPRVRQLADEIIRAQRREIDEMKTYIADLEGG